VTNNIFLLSVLLTPQAEKKRLTGMNGTEAKPHSRPFMVSLQKNWRHICGGFLISDRFVMTAAHSVVGAHDLRQNEESVRIGVKSYHMHPDFNMHTLQNDIMLLRLEKEVEQNKNVMKISLQRNKDIEADSVCRVAGWGRLSFKGKKSFRLMEADVKIMNNTELLYHFSHVLICVPSQEDGGGPLVCKDTAVGVTSFGDPKICNSHERPEVYIKISAYSEWICSLIANVE
uniref:trypsin n=1 Tax=Sinocyclocheilus grahami TaxID=75366 RepID=A0A672L9V8_SINGR